MIKPTFKTFLIILGISVAITFIVKSPDILNGYADFKITKVVYNEFIDASYDREGKALTIFASGNNEKEILDSLLELYIVAKKSKRVDSIVVFIENKENDMLILSRVDKPEFKKINWFEVETYKDFKNKANINQTKL